MNQDALITTTERLDIRPPQPSDVDRWREGHRLWEAPRSRFDLIPRSKDELSINHWNSLLEHLRESEGHVWFLFLRTAPALWVGTLNLFDILRGDQQNAWLGYHILHPYWGQGLAPEAVRAAFNFAFGPLNLHRVEALTERDNIASQRVAEKVGMRLEGISRRRVLQRDSWRDAHVYAFTREDWMNAKKSGA